MKAIEDEQIIKKIREIMHDWEGNFPFPEPEDAGYEADLIYDTPQKLLKYIKSLLEEAVRQARIKDAETWIELCDGTAKIAGEGLIQLSTVRTIAENLLDDLKKETTQ